jgi:hypothetical protein
MYMHAHAHTNTYTYALVQALGKPPTGISAGMAKLFLSRFPGATFNIDQIWVLGLSTVRYSKFVNLL